MLKNILCAASLVSSTLALGQTQSKDLTLDGERWLGAANGYVCKGAVSVPVAAPSELTAIGTTFESVSTDITLDNGLLKATFTEDGETCRYSALLLADNKARTVVLVESRAYSVLGTSLCESGKALLDSTLGDNAYNFQERPHHLTVLVESADAEAVCGAGAKTIGIDFTLKGKVTAPTTPTTVAL